MATKNNKKKTGLKKHDWLRIVGEPIMIAGHCATMISIGGMAAKAATLIGAAAMMVWVTVEVIEFVGRRKHRVKKVVCPA